MQAGRCRYERDVVTNWHSSKMETTDERQISLEETWRGEKSEGRERTNGFEV